MISSFRYLENAESTKKDYLQGIAPEEFFSIPFSSRFAIVLDVLFFHAAGFHYFTDAVCNTCRASHANR